MYDSVNSFGFTTPRTSIAMRLGRCFGPRVEPRPTVSTPKHIDDLLPPSSADMSAFERDYRRSFQSH